MLLFFKVGVLIFWDLWYLMAFLTNLCEAFKSAGILRNTWPFASGNLQSVAQALRTSSASRWLPQLLFFGAVCWQFLVVLLFGWAIISSLCAQSLHWPAINGAFSAGLGLWAAFMLADEILKQYDTEHAHVLFFIAQLATFVAVHLLPSA